jgi:hypothetical protein
LRESINFQNSLRDSKESCQKEIELKDDLEREKDEV